MRKLALLVASVIITTSLFAQSGGDTALRAAIRLVPTVVGGTETAETKSLKLDDFVIAEETITCDHAFLSEWVGKWHSRRLAEELAASYRDARPARVAGVEASIRILALDQFSTGEHDYDWQKLQTAHPDIRGIVRMSLPALDSQNAYAVVHYEVITPQGRAFANFQNLEKQGDGTWDATSGVTGWWFENPADSAVASAARVRSAN